MTIPLTSWIIVIIAAALGTLARWLGQKVAWPDWLCFFLGLLVFGIVLLFVKIT
jgi:hypothetical protein